jgi:hypothetical protein
MVNPMPLESHLNVKRTVNVLAHLFPAYQRALDGCMDPLTDATDLEVQGKSPVTISMPRKANTFPFFSASRAFLPLEPHTGCLPKEDTTVDPEKNACCWCDFRA